MPIFPEEVSGSLGLILHISQIWYKHDINMIGGKLPRNRPQYVMLSLRLPEQRSKNMCFYDISK